MIIGDRTDLVCHSSEVRIALVPPMSVKDCPLHWILVRSQIYYSEHILVYGSREGLVLSCCGFRLFPDRLIGGGDGGGLSTTLSPGLRCRGLESKFGRRPGPLDRRVVGWSCLCLGTSGACVLGYPAGHIGSRIAG